MKSITDPSVFEATKKYIKSTQDPVFYLLFHFVAYWHVDVAKLLELRIGNFEYSNNNYQVVIDSCTYSVDAIIKNDFKNYVAERESHEPLFISRKGTVITRQRFSNFLNDIKGLLDIPDLTCTQLKRIPSTVTWNFDEEFDALFPDLLSNEQKKESNITADEVLNITSPARYLLNSDYPTPRTTDILPLLLNSIDLVTLQILAQSNHHIPESLEKQIESHIDLLKNLLSD